ncbi:MAG: hypothetical protein ACPL6C_03390 [bacterium]
MKKAWVVMLVMSLFGVIYAATEGSGIQKITMNVTQTLTLTIPADLAWGDLSIGDNASAAQNVLVQSNDYYDLKIKTSPVEDSLGAYMPKQYDTVADTFFHAGYFISDTLQWKGGDVASYTNISPTYALILDNADPTPDAGTTTPVYYNINVGYGDRRLTGTNQAYCIKVNFFATQTIAR